MKGDLHCHSKYSDGSCTPKQIILYARRIGLDCISITDHDTMKGVNEAYEIGRDYGIKVISGVECTTRDQSTGRPVHVLCYQPKDPSILNDLLTSVSQRRKAAKASMMEKLSRLYPVTVEDAFELAADSASIFESHIMTAIANAGYTNQPLGDLMEQLIGKNGSCYVPIEYPDIISTIDLIHHAGGLAVIAHPGQFDTVDLAARLAKEHKIEGIECYHYRNSIEVTGKCLSIARENNLVITGGSDFHGMYSRNPHPLGFCTTDDINIKRILGAEGNQITYEYQKN